MAQLTAANAAAFGHQGAEGRLAFYSTAMPTPISLAHCFYMERGRGFPSCYYPVTGALPAAAADSEGASAVTPSALSTPTGTTLTPAKYIISLAINSEAQQRSLEENDPLEIAREFAVYGCSHFLMTDNTVGLSEVFGTVSATGGNTGAQLTLDGVLSSAENVRANLNDANLVVSAIIDGKGQRDLQTDMYTGLSSAFANPVTGRIIEAMLAAPESMQADADDGYWFSPDGKTGIFVEAGYAMLDQAGGDRVGVCCISPTDVVRKPGLTFASRMQGGAREISPAFALAVEPEPAVASFRTAKNAEYVDSVAGPLALMERDYVGPDFWTLDVRGSGDVALVNDNSASQLLYLA